MKRIYIYHDHEVRKYFSTLKKLFKFCLSHHPDRCHKTFAVFERWINQDGLYAISADARVWAEAKIVR